MRDIKIGDKEIRVAANPVTPFFYKKEFGTDMIGDFFKASSFGSDITKFDGLIWMQVAWAMAKSVNVSASFPDFKKWLSEFEYLDFNDTELYTGLQEEVQQGLFRDAKNQSKANE